MLRPVLSNHLPTQAPPVGGRAPLPPADSPPPAPRTVGDQVTLQAPPAGGADPQQPDPPPQPTQPPALKGLTTSHLGQSYSSSGNGTLLAEMSQTSGSAWAESGISWFELSEVAPPDPGKLATELKVEPRDGQTIEQALQDELREYNWCLVQGADSPTFASYARQVLAGSDVDLAVAGFSSPPDTTYEPVSRQFLKSLVQELGGSVGFITSPTIEPATSIDAICSAVSQQEQNPIVYVTALDYMQYADDLPETGLKAEAFKSQPKFAFPDAAAYSAATAPFSNAFLTIGGANQAVRDLYHAVEAGRPAVVVDYESDKMPAWNEQRNRVGNASALLRQVSESVYQGKPWPEGVPREGKLWEGFTVGDLAGWLGSKPESSVRFVTPDASGVRQAAEWLRN
ncbi:MAG: hypothetical protein AMXMBFR33_58780 [Candidatus Xenobia bacterium]